MSGIVLAQCNKRSAVRLRFHSWKYWRFPWIHKEWWQNWLRSMASNVPTQTRTTIIQRSCPIQYWNNWKVMSYIVFKFNDFQLLWFICSCTFLYNIYFNRIYPVNILKEYIYSLNSTMEVLYSVKIILPWYYLLIFIMIIIIAKHMFIQAVTVVLFNCTLFLSYNKTDCQRLWSLLNQTTIHLNSDG